MILVYFIVFGLACNPPWFIRTEGTNVCNEVIIYSKESARKITQTQSKKLIIEEAVRLLAHSDDIYWKPISQNDISEFRNKNCIEIIFEKPKKIKIRAIKKSKIINKILIPLDELMCADYAHIIYGDPDYKTFNLLLNSEGCERLKIIIKKLST